MTTIAEALTSAVRHHGAGRLAEAEHLYRQILAVAPDHPDALHLLGVIANQVGRHDLSAELIGRSVAIRPGFAEAHYNLGLALQALTRWDEAIASYDLALALKPDHAVAHNNRANALKSLGRFDEAVAGYGRAITVRPDYAEAHNNLGICLHDDLKRLDEAAASYRRALALDPRFVDALANLGNALRDLGRLDEAVEPLRQALALDANSAKVHDGLGGTYCRLGRVGPAIEHFQIALSIDPDLGLTRVNHALALFLTGRLADAWSEYEWRWSNHGRFVRRPFPQPWWDGQPLDGRTLLIWGEQGLGDEILGVGMLGDAMKLAPNCVVECAPRLVELFARSFPEASFVARADPPHPDAMAADQQIPLFSLAGYLRDDIERFPHHSGYLRADPAKAAHWKSWLDDLGPGLKVGVSWKHRPTVGMSMAGIASVEALCVMLKIPGLVFVNLQYDDVADDVAAIRNLAGVEVHCPQDLDLTDDLDGVAALTAGLDVVVGPLTAVVMLAGALGRPTFLYAYYPPFGDKTVFDCDHVPWCPSIRVEKCGFGEDWGGALGRIADGLRALVASRGQSVD